MKFTITRERIFFDGLAPEQYIEGLACFSIDGENITPEEFSYKILLYCLEDSFEYKQL